jgi:hypothetical protein
MFDFIFSLVFRRSWPGLAGAPPATLATPRSAARTHRCRRVPSPRRSHTDYRSANTHRRSHETCQATRATDRRTEDSPCCPPSTGWPQRAPSPRTRSTVRIHTEPSSHTADAYGHRHTPTRRPANGLTEARHSSLHRVTTAHADHDTSVRTSNPRCTPPGSCPWQLSHARSSQPEESEKPMRNTTRTTDEKPRVFPAEMKIKRNRS